MENCCNHVWNLKKVRTFSCSTLGVLFVYHMCVWITGSCIILEYTCVICSNWLFKVTELRSLCRGGIPDRFRKQMWRHLVKYKVRDLVKDRGDYYYRNLCNMLPESPVSSLPLNDMIKSCFVGACYLCVLLVIYVSCLLFMCLACYLCVLLVIYVSCLLFMCLACCCINFLVFNSINAFQYICILLLMNVCMKFALSSHLIVN